MKRQSGFTLIEMVAVIIILAIMAAIAFPKFTNLSGQARLASLNGLAGSIRSAVTLAKATWLANNSGVASTVNMNGTAVSIITPAMAPVSEVMWGVPRTSSAIIWALDGNTTGYTSTLLGGNSGVAFWPTGVASQTACSVYYASGTATLAASAAAGDPNACL